MIVWGEEAIATAKAQQGASFDPNNVFFSPSIKEPALEGFQILAVEQTSPDAAEATLLKKFKNGKADMTRIPLVKVADEWKWYVANPADVTPIPFIQPAGN
jgi:hypothetical protein